VTGAWRTSLSNGLVLLRDVSALGLPVWEGVWEREGEGEDARDDDAEADDVASA